MFSLGMGRRYTVLATLLLALTTSSPVAAQVAFEVPEDPRERLTDLDEAVLAKQRALFAARQRGDQQAVEKLSKEFDEIQRQRSEILKRAHQLY